MPYLLRRTLWRTATFVGAANLLIGKSAIVLDYVAKGGIDLIDEHFSMFVMATAIGTIVMAAGMLGWAISTTRAARAAIGSTALLCSISITVLGLVIGGTNVHGPFFLIFLPMLGISLVSVLILLITAFRTSAATEPNS